MLLRMIMKQNDYYTNPIRHLLGMGFDGKDGHYRITQGDYFRLIGGSEETHSEMQEKTVRLIETLNKRGKTIITASDREFIETAIDVGMKIFSPQDN